MLRISFCIFIIKYKCSIFYLHAVLFPLKYTWAGLSGRSDAYILKLLNKKTNMCNRIYFPLRQYSWYLENIKRKE